MGHQRPLADRANVEVTQLINYSIIGLSHDEVLLEITIAVLTYLYLNQALDVDMNATLAGARLYCITHKYSCHLSDKCHQYHHITRSDSTTDMLWIKD